ncbi:hypothetical protein KFE19_04335 [Dysosmobacter sp. Marseille-Q4140]|nr:hypothetical protein KFE19_04335 [Dysosmobacter sp. Marseille-Q4140]
MPMKQWGNAYRTTVVCVDSYDEHVLRGRLYNPHRPEGIAFRSAMEFLLRMEDLLDDMHFPQSFSAVRSFGAPPERTAASPPAAERQEGQRATFAVRVLFRQNASWQGSLTWLEEGKEESFRSVLELLLLMHSALDPETR